MFPIVERTHSPACRLAAGRTGGVNLPGRVPGEDSVGGSWCDWCSNLEPFTSMERFKLARYRQSLGVDDARDLRPATEHEPPPAAVAPLVAPVPMT